MATPKPFTCFFRRYNHAMFAIPLDESCRRAGGHGGSHVEVEGSFDNWTMRQPMQRSGKDFTIVKLLPPGVYQVQFLPRLALPHQWMCSLGAAYVCPRLTLQTSPATLGNNG